jgi:hypothetical protein
MMSGGMRKHSRFLRHALAGAILLALPFSTVMLSAEGLDYEAYKTKVEPLFLKKRVGHARCVACHEASNSAFRLQPLDPGSKTWTEEESRKNFENVSHLVKPGDPDSSKLLIHPLAHDGGGDLFHSGGRQFLTKDDPEWKTMANWVKSAK